MKLFRIEHLKAENKIRAKVINGFDLDSNEHWNSILKDFVLLLKKVDLSYYDFSNNRNLLFHKNRRILMDANDYNLISYIYKTDIKDEKMIDLNHIHTYEFLHIKYRLEPLFLEEMKLFS